MIGAAEPSPAGYADAFEVGRLIAAAGAVLVCGGLGGVMAAACRGAREAGGLTLGILPGSAAASANPWVVLPVVTDLGHARNVVIAHTAEVLIAIEGGYGTLSEIAVSLKLGRQVFTLGTLPHLPGAQAAETPRAAVAAALAVLAHLPEREDTDGC
ncbi:TIGR00725 family protein [Desulfuromonas carbonis]